MQIDKKLKGCIVFTSSAAACIPSPFGVTYAATKSFLSSFGASLAPEVKHLGIDVMVAHPSPVSSRSALLYLHHRALAWAAVTSEIVNHVHML